MRLKIDGSRDRFSANRGVHRVNCRYKISSIHMSQQLMWLLFMKFSFIHLMRFRTGSAGILLYRAVVLNVVPTEKSEVPQRELHSIF